MDINNINSFRNVKNDILKCFAHAVAQATDVTEMIRQHVAQSGSECHIVGDMKCFADTSLRRSEFFISWSYR
jgi:hypothetical protein